MRTRYTEKHNCSDAGTRGGRAREAASVEAEDLAANESAAATPPCLLAATPPPAIREIAPSSTYTCCLTGRMGVAFASASMIASGIGSSAIMATWSNERRGL